MDENLFTPFDEDFNGTGSSETIASSIRGGFTSPAPKLKAYISYDDRILEQLEILLSNLPIPQSTPPSLIVRGVSLSYFDSSLASNEKYRGNAVKLYQLIRHMKWLVFCSTLFVIK